MDFITHALNWCRGEIFMGKLIALFTIGLLIVSLCFWKLGTTPFAKAMFLPLLVLSLVTVTISGGLFVVNGKRIVDFQQAYQQDPQAFIASEKERTDYFVSVYPTSMKIMAGILILGIALYLFWTTANGRAIALAVMLMGVALLFIENFSQERGVAYSAKIDQALNMTRQP